MKTALPRMIETRAATLERMDGNLVEVRFKPEVKLDLAGLAEVVHAKRVLCHTEEMDVLAVLPPEVDLDLNLLSVDHDVINGGCGLARRSALVAQSPFNERLATIYFRYHPREHATHAFLEEADARE